MERLNKTYRILITPNHAAPYDQRMVNELATAFNGLGHHAMAMMSPQSATELLHLCKSFSINVVIQINRTRDPDIPLPSDVRHISWYQDVLTNTHNGFAGYFHDSDILYTLTDPLVLGLNNLPSCFVSCLFTGVDKAVLDSSPQRSTQDIDFSLCGGIDQMIKLGAGIKANLLLHFDQFIKNSTGLGRSRMTWMIRQLIFGRLIPFDYVPYSAIKTMEQIVKESYRPLRGELDTQQLVDAMWEQNSLTLDMFREIPLDEPERREGKIARTLTPYVQKYSTSRGLKARLVRFLAKRTSFFYPSPSITEAMQIAIKYFSLSYPRIIDREAVVKLASSVSDSLALYGPGLKQHDFVHPYYKGVINNRNELLNVYCRSKINLSTNPHGLGIHSRILECMAVNGFIFMHESPRANKPGGMLTAFEPDVHYGSYNPENFAEEAKRWLHDDKARFQIGTQARELIREQHCWHHRAQQILDDLNQ